MKVSSSWEWNACAAARCIISALSSKWGLRSLSQCVWAWTQVHDNKQSHMIPESIFATVHVIYSRTHEDRILHVRCWSLVLPWSVSWEAPYQVYHSVYEHKPRFKNKKSHIMLPISISTTVHTIYSRTHGDAVSNVPWCGQLGAMNESWGPPYQVYHGVYEHKPSFKITNSRIW